MDEEDIIINQILNFDSKGKIIEDNKKVINKKK